MSINLSCPAFDNIQLFVTKCENARINAAVNFNMFTAAFLCHLESCITELLVGQ